MIKRLNATRNDLKNIEQSMIYKNNTFRDFDNFKISLQSPAMGTDYQYNRAITSSLSALDLSDTFSAVNKIGASFQSPAWDTFYQSDKAIASSLSALDLSDTFSAVNKIRASFQSPTWDTFYQSNKAIASSLSALDLSDTFSAVNKIGASFQSSSMGAFKHFGANAKHFFEVQELVSRQLQDIEEAYEEYRNFNSSLVREDETPYSVNNNQPLTEEDVKRIFNDMQSQQNEKKSLFKDFVRDVLVSYGTDALKSLVNLILLPLFSMAISYLIENHYEIINAIQNSVDNSIYVIGYISAKKYIKEQRLTSYENINRIGILREASKVRLSSSRHSAFSSNLNIPKNTIVNIIEKRGNWIKLEAQIKEQIIEGWIEESKVTKFKKEN